MNLKRRRWVLTVRFCAPFLLAMANPYITSCGRSSVRRFPFTIYGKQKPTLIPSGLSPKNEGAVLKEIKNWNLLFSEKVLVIRVETLFQWSKGFIYEFPDACLLFTLTAVARVLLDAYRKH